MGRMQMNALTGYKNFQVECIGREHRAVPLPFTRDTTVYNMLKQYDLARPLPEHVELTEVIDWALEKRKHFDEFIVFAESRNGCWTHVSFLISRKAANFGDVPW